MDTREVPCSAPKCRKAASYKIAAPWSDGRYEELTTYELACIDHFATAYREAERRKLQFPPSSNEKVGEVGIYRCSPDRPSKEAMRLLGLEATCRSWDQAQQKDSPPNNPS
jgi:hypothetical protein